MLETIDLSLVNWSRAQFALTAMYHWIFVPLTLGITLIIAFMETIYVRTGNPEWKRITKFWMTLFGINFAIGVATGIILEFEFGTNWSNYSWFVGDIFGAPLAIEGIFAFFMESTFIAVMFFGWNKVSKKFHLLATWLTAIGANLSALWILVANGWMQKPVGMVFNPETARNEMMNFWDVLFSPMAVHKFLHTTSSSFVLASIFVIGVSAWFLLKKRDLSMAKKSIAVAAVFGFLSSVYTVLSGDSSARQIAHEQPMKFAAFEGLYNGSEGAGLIAFGVMSTTETDPDNENLKDFNMIIEIPNVLSYMAFLDWNAFVPGVNDLIKGNPKQGIMSAQEKIDRGKIAIQKLKDFKDAKKAGQTARADSLKTEFMSKSFQDNYFKYFGYGYITDVNQLIPSVPLSFYSFHIMVVLGGWFMLFFILSFWFVTKGVIQNKKWFLRAAIWTIPLAYLASQAGWVVAEVGRQPWVIQDLMPTMAAVTRISSGAVMVTFWLFAAVFTTLLIAEIKIMIRQIKIGPHKEEGGNK
ncbi:MAG: cytochrome C oxidase subunit II [Bacteroidetes bacterium GWF2_42_66]|nr:MAG: cytochrome C oxidase subunit II [Bacteroidetes bacterium GWA2_42_15]OFX97061.1 MAG: cytochrome C oxidase subunit II [Bacteroidetes bacterium GWE2_42_39]OFY46135.1 MAG: cytochrome C oxidase subunit II [Bacteroidetes bacterium GWF2_42_66]HBL75642.1 cytochrome ubiquinol oxidase subunit I [Prolixibacteraceae bacterium]HCR91143.1 cytochrome ubiquinol oxidase subunit I [Prolixibacteraceae bacterium]